MPALPAIPVTAPCWDNKIHSQAHSHPESPLEKWNYSQDVQKNSFRLLNTTKEGEIPENSLLFQNSHVQQMEPELGFQDLRGQNQQNWFCAPVKCWIFSMAEACQQGRFRSVWNLGWTIPKDVKGGQSSSDGSERSVGSWIFSCWLQI